MAQLGPHGWPDHEHVTEPDHRRQERERERKREREGEKARERERERGREGGRERERGRERGRERQRIVASEGCRGAWQRCPPLSQCLSRT